MEAGERKARRRDVGRVTRPKRAARPALALLGAFLLLFALSACNRFISHESDSAGYDVVEQSNASPNDDGAATFDWSFATSPSNPPPAYGGSRVAKVHLNQNPTANTKARGVVNLSGPTQWGFYGAALYFPPGTLSGADPKQQRDVDVLRWDNTAESEFGGLRVGSDHRVRLIRGQSGQPVETIGSEFSFQEGCWNWVVVEQRLSSDPAQRYSKVHLNGQQVLDSTEPNFYGALANKVRFGAVTVGAGSQRALDFYLDQSFVSNDGRPDPTSEACDPVLGGAEPSAIPMSVQTPLADATSFLYQGDFPLQVGVAAGTIKEERAAVLNGRLLDRAGQPLEGVRASVPGHPEFGSMTTRSDGKYYLAVNGGGDLRVRFEHDGFLPVERALDVDWQQYEQTEDVVLTPLDAATDIDLSASGIQVVRGTTQSDGDGARQATLLFPEDTTASMTVGGTSQPLTDLTVRATEYTVDDSRTSYDDGPKAMPAELPPTSAYTYAAAYTVDEALEAGATEVTFQGAPVISYTDNFLSFPVGEWIPAGYYDRAKGAWVPAETDEQSPTHEDQGRVVKILAVNGGVAELDTDGDDQQTQAELDDLGITLAERQELGEIYELEAPKTLWRVPVKHFTDWDYNLGFSPPLNATYAKAGLKWADDNDDDCSDDGSVIECEDQVLGEHLDLAGSDFGISYRSDRAEGRDAADRIEIPLTDSTPPPGLQGVELVIEVAGERIVPEPDGFSPAPDQSYTFTWDGRDVFGRRLQGSHPVRVGIGYVYDGVYQRTPRFGYNGNGTITASETRRQVTLWTYHTGTVGTWDARGQGLGGWSPDVHHVYDPDSQILYRGDGTRQSVQEVSRVARRAAGDGSNDTGDSIPAREASLGGTAGVVAAPDGGYYLSEPTRHIVRRVSPEGTITRVAGIANQSGFSGDEGPATQAKLSNPQGLDVGADGSLYIADHNNSRVRRVFPDGTIDTVAGGGSPLNEGDGGPAADVAGVREPLDVAVAADGSFYISAYQAVRRVDPDGIIDTPHPAPGAGRNVSGIDLAPDGALYMAEGTEIKRLGPDGRVTSVAGQFDTPDYSGDGGPATQAKLRGGGDVVAEADGSFYFADYGNQRVRRVSPEGIITTVAGNGQGTGSSPLTPDDTPAPAALIDHPNGLSVGADGTLLVADSGTSRIVAVRSPLPGFSGDDIAIPSEDGRELYRFNKQGRHLQTVDTLTGSALYTFGYLSSGQLDTITDGDDNETQIDRDGSSGDPIAIVAPFGHRTTLSLDSDGYLDAVTNPESEQYRFGYEDGDGLLSTVTDPRDGVANYGYDSTGRLDRAEDRENGDKTLSRQVDDDGATTTIRTKLGQTDRYEVRRLRSNDPQPGPKAGDTVRTHTDRAGLESRLELRQDGSKLLTAPDGMKVEVKRGGDARFGMRSPVLQSHKTTTPGGRTREIQTARQPDLADETDPLSLEMLTDTFAVNGRDPFTTVYTAAQGRFVTTSPEGRTNTTDVDPQGRITRQEVPQVNAVVSGYDANGRLEDVQQGTRDWHYTYEPGTGLLDTVTDPTSRVTSFDYDLAGRLEKQILPGGREVLYDYDDNGNLASVTPRGRTAHLFDHNAVDLVDSYTPPQVLPDPLHPTTYTYNDDQQLEKITRPVGEEIDFVYETTPDPNDDDTRRLDYFDQATGRTDVGYHSQTGNVSSLGVDRDLDGQPEESLGFSYDGSLPTRETFSGTVTGEASRSYDNDFRIAETKVNDTFAVDYTYDDDSLLKTAGPLTLSRNSQNWLLTGLTLQKTGTTLTPNAFGELDQLEATYAETPETPVTIYKERIVQRDDLGRIQIKEETTSQGTHSYEYVYDPQTGFLKEVKQDTLTIATYGYDDNGNRLSRTSGGNTVTGTYDAQDRLKTYDGATYSYTPAGDLALKEKNGQTTAYSYDSLGALENVTLPDGTALDYVNDPLGRRIAKKRDGVLEQGFLYGTEAAGPVAELDAQGDVRSRFVYATRSHVPDYMVRSGSTYRIIADHLGSPRIVVDVATGDVAQELDYDEFGNVVRETSPGFQPFGYAGGLYDRDTELVRFGARDYDAETGRWTARDPILFGGRNPNLYGYVMNDPINRVDPLGLLDSGDVLDWIEGVNRETKPVVEPIRDTLQESYCAVRERINELTDPIEDFYDWLDTREGRTAAACVAAAATATQIAIETGGIAYPGVGQASTAVGISVACVAGGLSQYLFGVNPVTRR